MATRGKRSATHGGRATHEEMVPTRRLVAVETARATVIAALLGCAVTLVLDALGMLVIGALPGDMSGTPDRLGRGIVAVAAIGIVLLGVLAGFLATAARFALADLYTGLDPKDRRLADTLLVRGQVPRSPFGPAIASVVVLGGFALLAALPCIVLAAEHAARLDDPVHQAEFLLWAVWGAAFALVVLLSAAAAWWLSAADRRWAAGPGARLQPEVVGDGGPAVRITSRASRRLARRGWKRLDWVGTSSRVVAVVGAGLVFFCVFARQPGLYATPVRYDDGVERLLDAGTLIGGVLLAAGLVVTLVVGISSTALTVRAMRRAVADPKSVTIDDRRRARGATVSLEASLSSAQALWTAVAVVAGGWWFAAAIETPADAGAAAPTAPVSELGILLLIAAWFVVGAALIGGRALLQAKGPELRNRLGYDVPKEADDREFPDLPLFGQ